MAHKLTSLVIALCSLLVITSCGTGKKLEASQMQVDDLRAETAKLQTTIDQLNKQVSDLNAKNTAVSGEYAQYKKSCAATEEKYKMTMEAQEREEAAMRLMQQKLETALADFKERGVDVYMKNGYVFVSLPHDLLYKSGSAALEKGGVEALAPVASILGDYPNLRVIVLGNTDDKMFKKGSDNWTLSTERANGVVRVFRDTYKIDPLRLTAAGKGKYNPIADNSTEEGRAKNRRTDIILNPDLDKIWSTAQAMTNN